MIWLMIDGASRDVLSTAGRERPKGSRAQLDGLREFIGAQRVAIGKR